MCKELKPSQLKAYHMASIVIRLFLLLRTFAINMSQRAIWRLIDMGVIFETFRGKGTANKAILTRAKREAKWRRKRSLVPPHDISTMYGLAMLFQVRTVALCFRCLWGGLQHRTYSRGVQN